MNSHYNFLAHVEQYVKDNPEVAAYIGEYVANGIRKSRAEALERAADMEVALSVAIAKRYNGRDTLILNKLEKWKDRSALKWDETIEMLKEEK